MKPNPIFQNKKLTFAVIICTVILLVMICWLITLMVQRDVFLKKVDALVVEIQNNEALIEQYQSDKEYRQTIEYLVEWATEHKGMLTQGQWNWIQKLKPGG